MLRTDTANQAGASPARVDPTAIEAMLAQAYAADGPGVQIAIGHRGTVVHTVTRGMANLEHGIPISDDTVFHVASLSKQVTAFAVALLADGGRLDLDQPANQYLSGLPACALNVTVRQLVHHTSGLRDQWCLLLAAGWRIDDVITTKDILDLTERQQELNFAPGTDYLYSNTGYTLLGELVRAITGTPFARFCSTELFAPLGMTATSFIDDHRQVIPRRADSYAPIAAGYQRCPLNYATAGATSLNTTAVDLLRWADNYDQHWVGGALDRIIYDSGRLPDAGATGYAFGLFIDDRHQPPRIGHGGADAGFRAQLTRIPQLGLTVACLSNLATSDTARLCDEILDSLTGPSTPSRQGKAIGAITSHAGCYANLDTAECLDIIAVDNTLHVEDIGVFIPTGAGVFRHGPAELVFAAQPGASSTVLFRVLSQAPITLHRIERCSSEAIPLDDYLGDYWSPELDVTYQLDIDYGQLTLRRRKLDAMPLRPSLPDAFTGHWGDPLIPLAFAVRFDRDDQVVTGMRLTMSRMRHLRLDRLGTGGAS
jgi:CubicO group peptidase (beta-lactamase class C family)